MSLESKELKKIITVLGSAGDFRMSVPEGTEGATKREYETSDGKKGTKTELAFKSVGGKISNVDFFDGDYGKNLMVTLDAGDDGAVTVSLGCSTPFGEDVLKKLPNIDMNEHVVLTPYAFEGDNGKPMKGVSITQGDVKIKNAFFDYDKKKNLLKYPAPEGDTSTFDADDWKMFFTTARKHTIKYAEENIVIQFGGVKKTELADGEDF